VGVLPADQPVPPGLWKGCWGGTGSCTGRAWPDRGHRERLQRRGAPVRRGPV